MTLDSAIKVRQEIKSKIGIVGNHIDSTDAGIISQQMLTNLLLAELLIELKEYHRDRER